MKELKVSAIAEGTVIDHIPAEATFKVVEILGLSREQDVVTVGTNLKSSKVGKKGVVKIAGRELSKREVEKIALIAPLATLNIIKGYKVIAKTKLRIPKMLEQVVKCYNPNCISNWEKIPTKFYVMGASPLKLRCHYCERYVAAEDIKIL